MTKILKDNYTVWKGTLIEATKSANFTLIATEEIILLDSVGASGAFTGELPDINLTDIKTNKKVWFYDNGNASTNNITITPNDSDDTTMQGGDYVISGDGYAVEFELINNVWIASEGVIPPSIGTMSFLDNTDVTTITDVGVYVDINATFTNGKLRNFTRSGDTLTYVGDRDEEQEVFATITVIRDSGAAPRDIDMALFLAGVNVGAVPITMTGSIESFSFKAVLDLVFGDTLKMRIRNNDDTANIIVITLNVVDTTL